MSKTGLESVFLEDEEKLEDNVTICVTPTTRQKYLAVLSAAKNKRKVIARLREAWEKELESLAAYIKQA